jgi:hypothetical protein
VRRSIRVSCTEELTEAEVWKLGHATAEAGSDKRPLLAGAGVGKGSMHMWPQRKLLNGGAHFELGSFGKKKRKYDSSTLYFE